MFSLLGYSSEINGRVKIHLNIKRKPQDYLIGQIRQVQILVWTYPLQRLIRSVCFDVRLRSNYTTTFGQIWQVQILVWTSHLQKVAAGMCDFGVRLGSSYYVETDRAQYFEPGAFTRLLKELAKIRWSEDLKRSGIKNA